MATTFVKTLLLVILSSMSGMVLAQAPINTLGEDPGLFRDPEPTGIAIRGYDAVAYHRLGTPTPGRAEHSLDYQGARWHFANAEHKGLFAANPEAYAPAYGGYCAYGVAQGYLVKVEPDQWQIVDGQLYLNYSAKVAGKWRQDIPGYIAQADQTFPTLFDQ
jgi:YHS domain-containing protein